MSRRWCSCTKGSGRSSCGAISPTRLAHRDRPSRVFLYSRAGHGRSDVPEADRTPRFMHEEALEVLPGLLREHGDRAPGAVGHSDGGVDRADPRVSSTPSRSSSCSRRTCSSRTSRSPSIAEARDAFPTPARAHGPLPPGRGAHLPAVERHLARARVPRLEHRGRAAARDGADARDPGRARPVRDAGAGRRDRPRHQRSASCSTAATRRTSKRRRRPCARRWRSCERPRAPLRRPVRAQLRRALRPGVPRTGARPGHGHARAARRGRDRFAAASTPRSPSRWPRPGPPWRSCRRGSSRPV